MASTVGRPDGVTTRIAEYAASLDARALPPSVLETTKRLALDTLGTALAAGTLGEGCDALVRTAQQLQGPPEATIIGFGERVSAPAAALANGGLAHALNFDAIGPGHLGVIAFVAPLAAAESIRPVSGAEFIAAAAAGAEVGARMAKAASGLIGRVERPWLEGQLLGYVGCTVAAGRIYRLTVPQMESAIGLAVMQAAGTLQVVIDGDPPAKAVYGAFPNHVGVLSALLARNGLAAEGRPLEGGSGFFAAFYGESALASSVVDGLGERFDLLDVGFKPWPTSGIVHPFIEAGLSLRAKYALDPSDIVSVECRGGPHILHWCEPQSERRAPNNAASAANSIFFGTAKALLHGEVTLRDFTDEALHDAETLDLTNRTTYAIDTTDGSTSRLTVHTSSGETLTERVSTPLGGLGRPLGDEPLIAKFRDCAQFAHSPVSPAAIEEIVQRALRLEELDDVSMLIEPLETTTKPRGQVPRTAAR